MNGFLDFLAEPWRLLFRRIARPYLDQARGEWLNIACQKQREAYEMGRQYGEAMGRLQGQRDLVAQLEQFAEERRDVTLNEQDIARAKKGMVH